MATRNKSMAKTIAKGAAGVALAAGAVAGVAALADKDLRKNMIDTSKKTLETARDRYQTSNHKISAVKKITGKTGRTTARKKNPAQTQAL